MKLIFNVLFVSFFIFVKSTCAAPVLVNDAGIYTGAKGIEVGNKIYDVQFRDGTFVDIFSGPDWIPFSNATDLFTAVNQLHELIMSNDELDANPWYTQGCGYLAACVVLTPVSSKSYPDEFFGEIDMASGDLFGAISLNDIPPTPNFVSYMGLDAFDFQFDTTDWIWFTWADWSLSSTSVPEPSSWILMLSMLGFCFYRYESKSL